MVETNQVPVRSNNSMLGIYIRGVAMGAADVVPGVSGGTVAFVTGIYEELLDSIRSINWKALCVLREQGMVAAWQHINGNFLLSLMVGILTSIVLLASVISVLLKEHPILVWSFFFGLVAASSIYMFRQVKSFQWDVILALLIGVAAAYGVAQMKPSELNPGLVLVFFSGCLAICAMILPGISGSFILVLLGMYEHILTAIKDFQWVLLMCFAAGCGTGLLGFSHLLTWLFKRYHNITLALLTGFLAGSLNLIWPWKRTLSYYQNRKGESLALEQENVLPSTYEAVVGNPEAVFSIGLMLFGVVLVLGLEKIGAKKDSDS